MKKTYNKTEIMKNAWTIRRAEGLTMSAALRKSWAMAKAPAPDITFAEVLRGGRRWTKGGHDRLYLGMALWDRLAKIDRSARTIDGESMRRKDFYAIAMIGLDAYLDMKTGALHAADSDATRKVAATLKAAWETRDSVQTPADVATLRRYCGAIEAASLTPGTAFYDGVLAAARAEASCEESGRW